MATLVTIATTAVLAITGAGSAVAAWAGTGLASAVGATGTGATLIGGMGEAAFVGLCSQAAVSVVQNQGNLLKAAESLATRETFKSVLMAAGSAGLTRGIGNVPTRIALGLAKGEKPEHILTGVVVDQVAKVLATRIGQGQFDYLTHKLAHTAVGAGTGAVLGEGQGALAGGFGALISEVVADAIKDDPEVVGRRIVDRAAAKGLSMTDETFEKLFHEEVRGTVDCSRLSAGLAAALTGQDASLAIQTATMSTAEKY